MFTLKATYDGYSGPDLFLSYSATNYAILYPTSEIHMTHKTNGHLHAGPDNFTRGTLNPKELAEYHLGGYDYASWRDYAFNMEGNPIEFVDGGQIILSEAKDRRLCVLAGNDRDVYWSDTPPREGTRYLTFTKVPYQG
jgi:hypothetical protein